MRAGGPKRQSRGIGTASSLAQSGICLPLNLSDCHTHRHTSYILDLHIHYQISHVPPSCRGTHIHTYTCTKLHKLVHSPLSIHVYMKLYTHTHTHTPCYSIIYSIWRPIGSTGWQKEKSEVGQNVCY